MCILLKGGKNKAKAANKKAANKKAPTKAEAAAAASAASGAGAVPTAAELDALLATESYINGTYVQFVLKMQRTYSK